jgi:hypothetical protein
VAGLIWRGLLFSLSATMAAAACLVVPGFLVAFGAEKLRAALVSALRNIDAALVVAVCVGTCLALIKSSWILKTRAVAARPGTRILIDLVATLALTAGLAAFALFTGFVRTGVGEAAPHLSELRLLALDLYVGVGMGGLPPERGVRTAVLCLPLAGSAWLWVSTTPVRRRGHDNRPLSWVLMAAAVGAAIAGCWAALFLPF